MMLGKQDSLESHEYISMGINPSGNADLHLGHHATLYELAKILEAQPNMKALLWVEDREFHLQAPPHLPTQEAVKKIESQVNAFLAAAEKHFRCSLQQRVSRKKMSEFFMEASGVNEKLCGQEIIRTLLEGRDAFGRHYPKMNLCAKRGVRPINSNTGFGPSASDVRSMRSRYIVHPHHIHANSNEQGLININTFREDNWALFYGYGFVRDFVVAERDDTRLVHLYGGDYALPWGKELISKAERNDKIAQDLSNRVDFRTAKLIVQDGQKLSKSGGADRARLNFGLLERISSVDGAVVNISAI